MEDRTDVEKLIGARYDDPAVQSLLAHYDTGAEVAEEDGTISWQSRSAGLEVSADATARRITSVFTYGPGARRHKAFAGALPGGVSVALTRDQIRERFGAPDKSGEEHDFWARDGYDISVEYRATGAVDTFTLMA